MTAFRLKSSRLCVVFSPKQHIILYRAPLELLFPQKKFEKISTGIFKLSHTFTLRQPENRRVLSFSIFTLFKQYVQKYRKIRLRIILKFNKGQNFVTAQAPFQQGLCPVFQVRNTKWRGQRDVAFNTQTTYLFALATEYPAPLYVPYLVLHLNGKKGS